jgi:hypothetical protein
VAATGGRADGPSGSARPTAAGSPAPGAAGLAGAPSAAIPNDATATTRERNRAVLGALDDFALMFPVWEPQPAAPGR